MVISLVLAFLGAETLVCGRRWEDRGEVLAGGGKQVRSGLELLSEDLLCTEVCKKGDGMLLSCFWQLKPDWFSSA